MVFPNIKKSIIESKRLPVYIKKYWFLYMLVLPGLVYFIIFHYVPIYGITLAFKDYNISRGIMGSPWSDPLLKHFNVLFQSSEFYRVLANTMILNLYNLVIGTSFILFLTLMLNEIRISFLRKAIQTLIYLPQFLSWVIFAGLVTLFLSPVTGPLNQIINMFGGDSVYFLTRPELFRGVLVVSGIVKTAGFGTIIYLAAIAGINIELYESAYMDGAHRGHMMWYITLPKIKPTIVVLIMLSLAGLFSSNFEQVFNLYNPVVYDVGDVLSTYLYRTGLVQFRLEPATALGLMFNLFGMITILIADKAARRMNVMGIF